MKKYLIIAACISGIILTFIFIGTSVNNKAIFLDKNIDRVKSNVETEEKRRFDLIPNLVDCVKQYDKHEYETLTKVIAARSGKMSDGDIDEIKVMINAVAESYPDLKSQKNYRDLMNELSNTENKIAQYRKVYNESVMEYQLYVEQFPSKQILNLMSYKVKEHEMLKFKNNSEDAPSLNKLF